MSDCSNKIHAIVTDRRILVTEGESILHLNNQIAVGTVPPGGLTNQVLTKCSNRNYHTKWEDISSLIPPPPPPPPPIQNDIVTQGVTYVMLNGDDATGQPDRFDLPYLTIPEAVRNSPPNQVIMVYSGSYVVDDTQYSGPALFDNANLVLEHGVEITFNINSTKQVFDRLGNHKVYGPGATIVINSSVNNGIELGYETDITLDKLSINRHLLYNEGTPNDTNRQLILDINTVITSTSFLHIQSDTLIPIWNNMTLPLRSHSLRINNIIQTSELPTTPTLISFNRMFRVINIFINTIHCGVIHEFGSYILFTRCGNVINMQINNFIRRKVLSNYSSLFGTDTSIALYNIIVNNFYTTGLVWNSYNPSNLPIPGFSNTPEIGYIKLRGIIDSNINPVQNISQGFFDFRRITNRIILELDVINLNGNDNINTSTINIGHSQSQPDRLKIRGRITHAPNPDPNPLPVISYGTYNQGGVLGGFNNSPSSVVASLTWVLHDLTIILNGPSSVNQYSIDNIFAPASTAQVPCMSCYSNNVVGPNATIIIDPITVNTLVM